MEMKEKDFKNRFHGFLNFLLILLNRHKIKHYKLKSLHNTITTGIRKHCLQHFKFSNKNCSRSIVVLLLPFLKACRHNAVGVEVEIMLRKRAEGSWVLQAVNIKLLPEKETKTLIPKYWTPVMTWLFLG